MIDSSNKCKQCLSDIPKHKKFCNSSCSAKFNNKIYPKRTKGRIKPKCLNCDEIINGRYSRKYCNIKCQIEHEEKIKFKLLEDGKFNEFGRKDTIDAVTKRYLIHKHGNRCMNEECGWGEINIWTNKIPIQLNHIDGDPENHNLKNVELLCPNCHSLTEFFGRRGKGRKWRYK